MAIEIKEGDYIMSDFASFIQGTVIGIGTIGKRIPAYKIKNPIGKIDFVIKGQAKLLLTPEESKANHNLYWNERHD